MKREGLGDRILRFDDLEQPTVEKFNRLFPLNTLTEPSTHPVIIGSFTSGELRTVYVGSKQLQLELK